jgi:hypothetical protein
MSPCIPPCPCYLPFSTFDNNFDTYLSPKPGYCPDLLSSSLFVPVLYFLLEDLVNNLICSVIELLPHLSHGLVPIMLGPLFTCPELTSHHLLMAASLKPTVYHFNTFLPTSLFLLPSL